MKRTSRITFLGTMLSLLFFFQSCREDEYWDDRGDLFGFRVESITNFGEKLVEESNVLRTRIKADYDFDAVGMYFQYTSSLDGILVLNGEEVNAGKEYLLEDSENNFTYIGREAGEHWVEVFFRNEKEQIQTKEFLMIYGLPDFSFELIRNPGEQEAVYQEQEIFYNILIKHLSSHSPSLQGDYQLAFTDFDPDLEISLGNNPIERGEFYKISGINPPLLKVKSVSPGKKGILGVIKNKWVEKEFEVDLVVGSLSVDVENLSLSIKEGAPGYKFSLSGLVKKTPISFNTRIQYKTWVSKFPQGGEDGIATSKGCYIPYDLGSEQRFNGKFGVSRNAPIGDYLISIQFRDEFGNESGVESFHFSVQSEGLNIFQYPTGVINVGVYQKHFVYPNGISSSSLHLWTHNFSRSFVLEPGFSDKILRIKYKVSFDYTEGGKRVVGSREYSFVEEGDSIDLSPSTKDWDPEIGDRFYKKDGDASYESVGGDITRFFRNPLIEMTVYTERGYEETIRFRDVEFHVGRLH